MIKTAAKSKSRGSGSGNKKKRLASPTIASAASTFPENQKDKINDLKGSLPLGSEALPPLKQAEETTFQKVFERLEAAKSLGKSIKLYPLEVDFIYLQFLSIEQRARRLPVSVEKSVHGLPPEIWAFTSEKPVPGTFEADAERNKKWVEYLSNRALQYLNPITNKILVGPSGAENEAAEIIARLVLLLIKKLSNAACISTPDKIAGRDASKEAYEAVITSCYRAVGTSKKQKYRNAGYAKRGAKKAHRGDFTFYCESLARSIIITHEGWLENAEGGPPRFDTFSRPMPAKRFGQDEADRVEWETWLFKALEHIILKSAKAPSTMKAEWRSHRSDLKNRLIPSYWEKAQSWRLMRKNITGDT